MQPFPGPPNNRNGWKSLIKDSADKLYDQYNSLYQLPELYKKQ